MFIGEFQHTIDDKGRLIMPAKYREALGDDFVITKGLEGCLFVYPQSEWSKLETKLRSLPFTKKDARAFARFFFSGAVEGLLDKQGRVLLPLNLRTYADLKKNVVIAGISSRIEIWSKENWDNYINDTEDSYEELAEKMIEFDIEL
ncbi:MraZ protein [Desulfonispora thiosulfatigenes DSM 11270]|uniref:Transcriptional regulator MraZ n=1 Tax=Desulfonispora thiosulfatigenes DSM 11270 TaxID=656914 RepID=A0A1W1VSW7_DESTI|nr:division/cell wall cluster transcriptional repressor MraZ [Desulfonispora thiosulfatigenes]SMB96448.1 MraZ protein [Desulfonispora thiosulfatigenes DSM 11270]